MKHFIEDIKEKLISFHGTNDYYEDEHGNLFIGLLSENKESGIKNYLHTFFAALNDEQIDNLEKDIQRKLPEDLRLF